MDIRRLSRREALRGVGMLTAGLVLGPACTKRVRPYVLDSPVGVGRNARHFTPVNVARDRVIRTVVGPTRSMTSCWFTTTVTAAAG